MWQASGWTRAHLDMCVCFPFPSGVLGTLVELLLTRFWRQFVQRALVDAYGLPHLAPRIGDHLHVHSVPVVLGQGAVHHDGLRVRAQAAGTPMTALVQACAVPTGMVIRQRSVRGTRACASAPERPGHGAGRVRQDGKPTRLLGRLSRDVEHLPPRHRSLVCHGRLCRHPISGHLQGPQSSAPMSCWTSPMNCAAVEWL